MGRNYVRTGKYLFFCVACLIFFSFHGCATLKNLENRHKAGRSFIHTKKLLTEGNFNDALKENNDVLSMFNKSSPGDKALFNMGLIYAHHGNPEKDYGISRNYFAELITEFPDSPLVDQARTWISLFDVIDTADKEQIKKDEEMAILNRKISDLEHLIASHTFLAQADYKKSQQENESVLAKNGESSSGAEALFNLGLIFAHHENPDKDYKKSAVYFKKIIDEYPQSMLVEQAKIWLGVLNVIEQSKQIDIEIEEKKKELAR